MKNTYDDFDLQDSYEDFIDENGYAREFGYVDDKDEDWYYYDAFIDDNFDNIIPD